MIFLLDLPSRPESFGLLGLNPGVTPAGRATGWTWHPAGVGRFESLWSRLNKFAYLNSLELPQAFEILSSLAAAPHDAAPRLPAFPDLGPEIGLDQRGSSRTAWALSRAVGEEGEQACHESLLQSFLLPDPSLGVTAQRAAASAAVLVCSGDLRFCPKCLARGFHSTLHQVLFVRTCPVHGVPMEEVCPSCRDPVPLAAGLRRISYGCPCGHRLWPGLSRDAWPGGSGDDGPLEDVAAWLRAAFKTEAFAARTLLLDPRSSTSLPAWRLGAKTWRRRRLDLLPLFWQNAARREGRLLPPMPDAFAPDPPPHASAGWLHRDEGRGDQPGRRHPASSAHPPMMLASGKWREPSHSPYHQLDQQIYRQVRRRLWRTVLRTRHAAVRNLASKSADAPSGDPAGDPESLVLATAFAGWRMYWEDLPSSRHLFEVGSGRGHGRVLCAAFQALEDTVWRARLAWILDVRSLEMLLGWPETIARHVLWEVYAATFRECVQRVAAERRAGLPTTPTLTAECVPVFILPTSTLGSTMTIWSWRQGL